LATGIPWSEIERELRKIDFMEVEKLTREEIITQVKSLNEELFKTVPDDSIAGYVATECDGCGEFAVCYDPGAFAGGFIALCQKCMARSRIVAG